jgi:mRNA-degrading endonuclease RelE of RelBE toxin-antitoxin system
MNCRIIPTPEFVKQAKKLSKKYPKLSEDLTTLNDLLLENPTSGTPLGNNCYKIRLQNTSSNKGKRGGFRIIIFFIEADNVVRLLAIYSKTERDNILDEEIRKVLMNNNLL